MAHSNDFPTSQIVLIPRDLCANYLDYLFGQWIGRLPSRWCRKPILLGQSIVFPHRFPGNNFGNLNR